MLLGAHITLHPREAAAEQAAVEVAVEFAPHERRQGRAIEARCDRGVQRLDVVADYRVERGRLRPVTLVSTAAGRVERNCGKPHSACVGRAACRASGPLPAGATGAVRARRPNARLLAPSGAQRCGQDRQPFPGARPERRERGRERGAKLHDLRCGHARHRTLDGCRHVGRDLEVLLG
jgi:hypothetical protein